MPMIFLHAGTFHPCIGALNKWRRKYQFTWFNVWFSTFATANDAKFSHICMLYYLLFFKTKVCFPLLCLSCSQQLLTQLHVWDYRNFWNVERWQSLAKWFSIKKLFQLNCFFVLFCFDCLFVCRLFCFVFIFSIGYFQGGWQLINRWELAFQPLQKTSIQSIPLFLCMERL